MSTISKTLQDAINTQVGREIFSAHLYLNLAAALRQAGLDGFGKWLEKSAEEERQHADKLRAHVVERNGLALVGQIEEAKPEGKNPAEVFAAVYAHEKKMTGWIYALYDLAVSEKDYAVQELLDWFAHEQVEEERKAFVILQRLKLIGDDRGALILFDKELE